MKCTITGANGFLGSRIARALVVAGHDVVALVGGGLDAGNLEGLDVEVRSLDLLDRRSVEAGLEDAEALVHTAALYSFWQPDPRVFYRVNAEGTRNVMRVAEERGLSRVVYTSTTGTLTPSVEPGIGTEESIFDLRRFQGHYKTSKLLAEMEALRAAARGLPVVIAKPTTVLGEGDRRPTPTGTIVVHFLNGRMKAFAKTTLNIVDVDDVAAAHVLALEKGRPGHSYIFGSENLSMLEIAVILSELTGLPAPRIGIPPRALLGAGHVLEWIANHVTRRPPLFDVESTLHAMSNGPLSSDKAQKELGYRPKPSRVAIAKATAWFVANGYCDPETARRIEAHGALQRALTG